MADFFTFELAETKPKTNRWAIVSRSTKGILGHIYWYAPWRKYVFESTPCVVWSVDCIHSVTYAIGRLNQEKKLDIRFLNKLLSSKARR